MTQIYIKNKKYVKTAGILIVVTALFLAVVYFSTLNGAQNLTLIYNILQSVFMTAGLWIGCALIVSYLWEKIPWEDQPVKRLLIEVPAIIGYTMLFGAFTMWVETRIGIKQPEGLNLGFEILITLLITLLITSIHESVFFYKQWKYNFSRSVRMEKDSIEARYEALKTQINPHFLFNSLNGLSNMVADNKEATAYIANLSDFLRYILASRDRELVLLREELDILNKYIRIQESRFGDNLKTELRIAESFYHYSVPPLVLQMLYENCIKHNIITADKPLKIAIFTEGEYIVVTNNYQPKELNTTIGQGLKNIVERYRYFTSNEVKIEMNKRQFTIKIPLLIVNT